MIVNLIFNDEYLDNNLSEKISKRLIEIYNEESFEWDDIISDFNDGFNRKDCFGVQYLIEIFGEYNIDLDEDYVWNLLKQCKPITKTIDLSTN